MSGDVPSEYPVEGEKVRVRLDPGGAWYFGTLIPEDSLHFSVNQSPWKKWRWGDEGVTWKRGWQDQTVSIFIMGLF